MNIALFTDSYLPTKSGIVTVVIQLKKILEDMGHHVVVVTVSSSEYEQESERDPTVLHVLSIHSPVGTGQYIGIPHKKTVVEFLRAHQIQIIHAHTEFFVGHMAVVAGRELDIPVVATTHTMWEDYYRYYLVMGYLIPRRMIRRIVRNLYRRFYALINVSQKAHRYFTKPFMLPDTPSAIIPNAIDSRKFAAFSCTEEDKARLRDELGILSGDRVILYVGRVVEEKRVVELLEIIRRVVRARENVRMVFVGSGFAEEDLRASVDEAGLCGRIIFTGFIDWERLALYYGIGDMFVTVSLSEMHSMTVLEAMSVGLPVVCRADESFADTVFHGENGYLADSDEEMDAYILDLVDNPARAERMGRRGFEIARHFSLPVHGRKTLAVYEEALRSYPHKLSAGQLQDCVDAVSVDEA